MTQVPMKPELKASLVQRAEQLIDALTTFDSPKEEWTADQWAGVARLFAYKFAEEELKATLFASIGDDHITNTRRRKQQDKDRIENRQDQIDKRAFQAAVKLGMDGYERKADAISDMKANQQFADYPEPTLRRWVTEIWTKPTKPGRPKKKG